MKQRLFSFLVLLVTAVSAITISTATTHASGNAIMYFQQLNPMVVGGTVTIQVKLNTMGSSVNTVESDFTYPAGVLQFESIDSSSLSAFPSNISATGGGGSVSIVRYVTPGPGPNTVTGDLKVANITFNVLAAGTANLTLDQGTSVADDAGVNTVSTYTNGSITNVPGIAGGHNLNAGSSIKSSNNQYTAIMQTDGNFVIYNASNQAVWNTKTAGNAGAHASMQSDGNFVVYSSSNKPLWDSRTNWYNGSNAVMQTDGNFVIYDSTGKALWSSKTGPIYDRMRPGQVLYPGDFLKTTDGQYRATMQTDGNFVVYNAASQAIWSTRTAGNAGAWATMQTDGNFVVYSVTNTALWNSRTAGNTGAWAIMQTDGNYVLYSSSNQALWSWKTGHL